MNMCTVREIREAIQEDCRSQRDMESTEIDRVFQTLPFSQERDLFDKAKQSDYHIRFSMQF